MMYEYDTYVDARKEFPRLREPLQTIDGEWFLVKSDVLAGTMTFSSSKEAMVNTTTLPVARVKEILALNRQGKKAEQLQYAEALHTEVEEPTYRSEEDSITRFDQAKRPSGAAATATETARRVPQPATPQTSRGRDARQRFHGQERYRSEGRLRGKKRGDSTSRTRRQPQRSRTRRNNERTNSGGGQNERGEGRRQEEARPGRERRQNTPAEAREKGPRGGENPAGSGDTTARTV